MPISKTPTQSPFPTRSTDQEPGSNRYSPIPGPIDLRNRALFGIPLKSSLTQQEMTDDSLQYFINEAISEIEHSLDLYITPVTFEEKHDYSRHEFTWSYNFTKLAHNNILSVNKVELSFSNMPDVPGFIQFPLEYVHVQPQEGTIQLVPAFGTSLSGFLLSAFSGSQFHALRAMGTTTFPGGVRVNYTCGFEKDKVPALLNALIETTAALRILSAVGPLLFPFSGVSIGIDGVSQSTSTPGPQFLANRINDLTRQKQEQMDAARGYYLKKFQIDVL